MVLGQERQNRRDLSRLLVPASPVFRPHQNELSRQSNPLGWHGMKPLWAYISYPVICSGIFFVFWALHVAAAR